MYSFISTFFLLILFFPSCGGGDKNFTKKQQIIKLLKNSSFEIKNGETNFAFKTGKLRVTKGTTEENKQDVQVVRTSILNDKSVDILDYNDQEIKMAFKLAVKDNLIYSEKDIVVFAIKRDLFDEFMLRGAIAKEVISSQSESSLIVYLDVLKKVKAENLVATENILELKSLIKKYKRLLRKNKSNPSYKKNRILSVTLDRPFAYKVNSQNIFHFVNGLTNFLQFNLHNKFTLINNYINDLNQFVFSSPTNIIEIKGRFGAYKLLNEEFSQKELFGFEGKPTGLTGLVKSIHLLIISSTVILVEYEIEEEDSHFFLYATLQYYPDFANEHFPIKIENTTDLYINDFISFARYRYGFSFNRLESLDDVEKIKFLSRSKMPANLPFFLSENNYVLKEEILYSDMTGQKIIKFSFLRDKVVVQKFDSEVLGGSFIKDIPYDRLFEVSELLSMYFPMVDGLDYNSCPILDSHMLKTPLNNGVSILENMHTDDNLIKINCVQKTFYKPTPQPEQITQQGKY